MGVFTADVTFCKDPYSRAPAKKPINQWAYHSMETFILCLTKTVSRPVMPLFGTLKNNTNAKLYGFPNASDQARQD